MARRHGPAGSNGNRGDSMGQGSFSAAGFARSGRTVAVLLAAAGALGACAVPPPRALFDLQSLPVAAAPAPVATAPGTPAVRRAAASPVQVLVPEPRALAALNTDSIAAKSAPGEISYFPRVLWADQLPKVVQARIVDSLENSGRIHAVGVPGQGLAITDQVLVDIRAFQFEAYRGRRGVVELAVQVMDDRNGRVVGARVFRAVAPAKGEGPSAAVAAMDAALQQVLQEMVPWIGSLV
ncbi:ABC-type transport auxiliary lipoprotein family protein [Pseudoxanthobacter sp.]|uniref:ABC-type transport auxiliary lipoprotein family protein n=1 Tax=Pseudoxanthobacter sp. TaxID=1925742 RepID=UPI002FDF13A2